ncbi:MAG: dienelactone hydrolase family protein [Rhodopirellula sp. JB044]|uniref:dienelactone hydrolase family protein n=1 Tax=Rhodopirellula sp. JB044 TaxID=3342844 RepID=UPI00370A5513
MLSLRRVLLPLLVSLYVAASGGLWSYVTAAETLPPLEPGPGNSAAPQTFDQLWNGFDPREEPLDVEVLHEWEEEGVVMKVLRYRIGIFKDQKAMMAAVYGYPKGASHLPGLLQIHGGGQFADSRAVLTNAKRGYATISIAWAGRISAPDYRVDSDVVKLFWNQQTDHPDYRGTTDWGALDAYHAPCRNPKNGFAHVRPAEWTLDTVDSPRNNPWFLCTLGARRALTFLESQAEVDADRLGVYGHSMGGKLTMLTAGSDPRIKAAAPSCGGISNRMVDEEDQLYADTIADDVYLKRVDCPIVFLSPSNDFHGRIDDLQKAVREIATDEYRVTCSPHHNHQDTANFEVATQLWFDEHLKGSFQWPQTPQTRLSLRTDDHIPSLSVTPDSSKPILAVDIYYTQQGNPNETIDDRYNPRTRHWHHVAAKQGDDEWTGELPLFDTDRPLWAYANVTYPLSEPVTGAGYYYRTYQTDRFNVSSLMSIVTPDELRSSGVKPTLEKSLTIETFDGDWQNEWFSYTPSDWPRRTHKINDNQWSAPTNATLSIEVQSEQPNSLVIGVDAYAAVIELTGGEQWQTIKLDPSDFQNANGENLANWKDIAELRIGYQETLKTKANRKRVGARWKGRAPQLRNLKWQAVAPGKHTTVSIRKAPNGPNLHVDFESFLAKFDMRWDRIPHRWEVAPYTGNGNVGFLLYQSDPDRPNVISLHVGRHDYYDHRLPHNGNENLWIYRSRLPLGHFDLTSEGSIESVDLRLGLWNAELTGSIQTDRGEYRVHGFSHSEHDVIYFETDAGDGESVKITWHPDEPMPPVRETLDAGGGPKGGTWDRMREAPLPMPPAPTQTVDDGVHYCVQKLYQHRGETTTGWKAIGKEEGQQVLLASVHHSFPEKNSREVVARNLQTAEELRSDAAFIDTHRKWWHEYYPLSFLSIDDPEKEAFYWIQMYKFASATRGNGPIMDLMGPWYHKTFWPMVWGDLNVELQYWTHLTANRLSVGESLCNSIDRHAETLYKNTLDRWKDSTGLATLFPQDMDASLGSSVPDMLCWILHDYWLHCEFAGDRERMRDKLFPLLHGTVNSYLNYLADNPVDSDDGTIHIKNSWSPEYPGGRGRDINFTIALIRWACQTLLDIDDEHALNHSDRAKWQHLLDNLADFQIDENGLRIGADVPFNKPHRHYSHLLAFYPLAVLDPDTEAGGKLLRTTLDHWLNVTFNSDIKVGAMPVTGYTATGAASMYAMLGDAEKAYHYLDFFIQHDRVTPTTMYAEGNPVIESPLSFATCIHDMLLQSWRGKIRVFPGSPEQWEDVAFHHLRTQGAFWVSAKKVDSVTEFVAIESLAGSPCVIKTDIANPHVAINGEELAAEDLVVNAAGFLRIPIEKGDVAVISQRPLGKTDLRIDAIEVPVDKQNLFGFHKKTERLPGHQHYSKPGKQ